MVKCNILLMRVIGGEEHTVFFDLYRTVLDMTLEYRLLKKQLNTDLHRVVVSF